MPDDLPLISAEPRGDALVVTVHVESFDRTNAAPIQRAVEAAAAQWPQSAVALDLGEVEMLTSPGLGALVYLHTAFQGVNRRFGVCGARGEAAEALRAAQLHRLLDVYRSVGDFLLRLRSGSGASDGA